MERLIAKYADKLVAARLAEPGAPLVGGLEAEAVWNRDDPRVEIFNRVFQNLNIGSLLFARPAEPYRTVIDYLARRGNGSITPLDCETRTFLHDLPVAHELTVENICQALKSRKGLIVPGEGLVAFGQISPEQAFVTFSSICFACFVLFFSDHLTRLKSYDHDPERQAAFDRAMKFLSPPETALPNFMRGPFEDEESVAKAMAEAGRATVEYGLVDSYFGNISYRLGDVVHISQTGSSLDELEGCMDPCPLDGSTCAGLTASSELTAHSEIYRTTDSRTILHGHPKFAVILSMDCDKKDCPLMGQCHIKCREKRMVRGTPIVPGEVGTGPHGLCHTLPPAIREAGKAIVYGHGLFTTSKIDFNESFKTLLETENSCREEYLERVAKAGGKTNPDG